MDSADLFATRSRSVHNRPVRERSRVGWIVLLSTLVPGSGHFVLGHMVLGSALLATCVLGTAAGFAVRFYDLDPLGWFLHRTALLAWIFSILDAPLLEQERADRRVEHRDPRSRVVGFLNAVGWGVGFLRLGERALGILAVLIGGTLHVVLALTGQPYVWIAEFSAIALSFWGATKAEERGSGGFVSVELGEMNRSHPIRASRQNTTPGWLGPIVAALVLTTTVGGVASWSILDGWLDSRVVRPQGAVAVEPYYRHPGYGVSLEMHSRGWAFREASPETFVFAQHLAEETRFSLRLRPRLPLIESEERAARIELEAVAPGFTVRSEGPTDLGGLPGYRMRADGMVRNRRTFVEIVTAGSGFRRFVFEAEWTAGHERFATNELEAVLARLSLDGRRNSTEETGTAR